MKFRPLFFALALIVMSCGLRWPGLDKQVWNLDEGSTFTMAEVVRNGGVMYRDAADNRTPLVPYIKALILMVVGDWNIRGAHIVIAIMLGLTAISLWRLARQAQDELAGIWAALVFSLISFVMLGAVDAMAAHTGWFLIFFSTLAFWAVVRAIDRGSFGYALAAGISFGLAALAKQPGLLDCGVAIVLCVLAALHSPGRTRTLATLAVLIALGFLGTLFATYGYFSAHDAWQDFLQYSWYYNTRLYVPEVSFQDRLWAIRIPFVLARENVPFVLLLGLVAAPCLLVRTIPSFRRKDENFPVLPWLILGWLASGLISTVLSGRDFAHYSIQVMPSLSLACGWVAARGWTMSSTLIKRGAREKGWFLGGLLVAGMLSLTVTAVRRATTFDLNDGISRDIGLVVKSRTQPSDRIFVWGYEPELHVFAERIPNTRFIYSVFLTGLIPWTNLDALKNTDYAIVPGSWDAFWHDFEKRPPEMIVDTRGNRGFLKYPLRKQKRLWALIEQDYVEVASDYANARGYGLYQRARPAPPAELQRIAEDKNWKLSVPEKSGPRTLAVEVTSPLPAKFLDLYLDGRPYRRMPYFGNERGPSRFFVVAQDLPVGSHYLQVVARGDRDVSSTPATVLITEDEPATHSAPPGPALLFNGEEIAPIEAYAIDGKPMAFREDLKAWDAHAPSRLVYERPAGLTQLDFDFGISPNAYNHKEAQTTDGVDVTVYFEDEKGKSTQLYRRYLNPAAAGMDQGTLTGHVNLPGLKGGKIILMITPGPMNNVAFDWSYWTRIEGSTLFFNLKYHGQLVLPVELDAPHGISQVEYQKRNVELIHAPSHFAFRDAAGMEELTGEFGLLDSAWQGPRQTNGAVFEVTQIAPDGRIKTLFSQALYPANKKEDRGFHPLKVSLPYVPGSLIRVSTGAAQGDDNSFNHTFWYNLKIAEFSAHIDFEGRQIPSLGLEAANGITYLAENDQTVLFAHVPSQITFPVPKGARRLTGNIGLMHGAYTSGGSTDGAVFIVESQRKGLPPREIMRRYLNPREIAGDRGAVPFAIDLPENPEGNLVLRTATAPSGRIDFGWSFWSELRFNP